MDFDIVRIDEMTHLFLTPFYWPQSEPYEES